MGINGIGFYTAETFVAAGKRKKITCWFWKIKVALFLYIYIYCPTTWFEGFSSGKIGTIAYACMQVVDPYMDFSGIYHLTALFVWISCVKMTGTGSFHCIGSHFDG